MDSNFDDISTDGSIPTWGYSTYSFLV